MDKIGIDLDKIGSTSHRYIEVFNIKDYQVFKGNSTFKEYKSKVKRLSTVTDSHSLEQPKMYSVLISWLSVATLMLGFMFKIVLMVQLAALFLVVSFSATIINSIKWDKMINKEESDLRYDLKNISDKNLFTKYFYNIKIDYYDTYKMYRNFKKLCKFLDVLVDYSDVTVYKLYAPLNFNTENYNHFNKRLMFKDNNTGKMFTYAFKTGFHSENRESIIDLITIFSIDIDTFEINPIV